MTTSAYEKNPYALWLLAYGSVFSSVLEQVDQIDPLTVADGSIQDAAHFFTGVCMSRLTLLS